MGEGEGSSAETKAHDLSSRQKENRSRSAGKVGEGEGGEDGCLEPAQATRLAYAEYSMTDLKKKPIIMFSGYFDESGITDNSAVCAIAGFLGGQPAMHWLAKGWNKVLTAYGVKVPFHSVQFYAPTEEIQASKTNPYRGWSKSKRRDYISDLIAVLRKGNLLLVGMGVDAVAFRARSEDERRWMTGGSPSVMNPKKWRIQGKPSSPYHFALRVVVEVCAERTPDGDMVHLFMSEQNQYEGFAMELYRAILDREPPFDFRPRLDDSITFGSHKKYPQLQAADLAAYHLYQFGLERRLNPKAEPNRIFKKIYLLSMNSDDSKFADAESIERICAGFKNKRDDAERQAGLRRTRLRVKVSHDPESCEILGTVDASGTFHPTAPST